MPRRALVVPDVRAVQVLPPSVVARIVPEPPTAKQVLVVGQLTPERSWLLTLDLCAAHVLPPFAVTRIVLKYPTAKQVLVLGQLMPRRGLVVPELRAVQVRPPSVVAAMPRYPTE
jgi:hypothetical protein